MKGQKTHIRVIFDDAKPTKYIFYLCANNLYGWAMCYSLPFGYFKWMIDLELENCRDVACILELDLERPKELHDLHNDFLLAHDRLFINRVEKLNQDLNYKQRYIIHHKNCEEYLDRGLKIEKIYRGIIFKEEPWVESHTEFNTRLRANEKNDFEKDFFKPMNTSVFGKTMENIRNHVDGISQKPYEGIET